LQIPDYCFYCGSKTGTETDFYGGRFRFTASADYGNMLIAFKNKADKGNIPLINLKIPNLGRVLENHAFSLTVLLYLITIILSMECSHNYHG